MFALAALGLLAMLIVCLIPLENDPHDYRGHTE